MAALVTLQPAASMMPAVRAPKYHLIPGQPPLVFLVDGSRLFQIDEELREGLSSGAPEAEAALFNAAGIAPKPANPTHSLGAPTSLSLNIAQSCNLSCSYCYADEGRFGQPAKLMSKDVAFAAIDQLIAKARPRPVTIGFIGGEPFLNRAVLHASVEHGAMRARESGVRAGFSVTTNGTLLDANDVALLRRHAFAVTISLDGAAPTNDAHRRTRGGGNSFSTVLRRVEPLLHEPGRARLAARATVTRDDLGVAERVEALSEAGFTDIGVSPLRVSPDPTLALRSSDWSGFLAEMTGAGEVEWGRLRRGLPFRFSNLAIALKEIHQGSARRLPCGAGANYVSLGANGEYFTCHRTVGDKRFSLGDALPDDGARHRFLAARDVEQQPECRVCWARYLCGGGCHAEVIQAGREGCDYIRGWLEYCLRFYDRLLSFQPSFIDRHPASGGDPHGPNFPS